MSDARADVVFDEIGAQRVTYAHDSTIIYDATKVGGSEQVGLAVTLETSKTVSLVGDGEAVEGRLESVDGDGFCVVQKGGYQKLKRGTSATLTPGKKIVGDLLVSAEGYIRDVATAQAAELGVARGRVVDATNTGDGEDVVVDLG